MKNMIYCKQVYIWGGLILEDREAIEIVIDLIYKKFQEETKSEALLEFRKTPKSELDDWRLGLGVWIRNGFLWYNKRVCALFGREYGLSEPIKISHFIIDKMHDRLNCYPKKSLAPGKIDKQTETSKSIHDKLNDKEIIEIFFDVIYEKLNNEIKPEEIMEFANLPKSQLNGSNLGKWIKNHYLTRNIKLCELFESEVGISELNDIPQYIIENIHDRLNATRKKEPQNLYSDGKKIGFLCVS